MGQLWTVPRALQSYKMHYLTKLKEWVQDTAHAGYPFHMAYPDTNPASGRVEPQPLSLETWPRLKANFGLQDTADFVEHLLNKHGGEVRLVDASWKELASKAEERIHEARFWSFQYARSSKVRN